jgi:EmrB/QacA subfamily drug resistance transporter
VLVSAAGILALGPVEAVPDPQTRAQLDVNLFDTLAVTRAFLPQMRHRRAGRIATIICSDRWEEPVSTDSTATSPPSTQGVDLDPRRWLALGAILVAAFMDLLDAGIVFLALPSIQQDLHAGYAALQWVAAGYTLAFALVLITAGRLGDILGRKRLFLVGVAGFTVASLACAVAQSPAMLVASRVLQGAMAATMIPQILSIIQANFPVSERAAAFGLYGAIGGMANVAGPPVAGLLLQSNPLGLGWRSIFLINLPIGVATLAAAAVLVRESRAPRALRLDPVGVGILTVGLLLVLYPLVQGRELGWPAWTFAAMVAAVPVLAVFVGWERRKTRVDGSPLVALGLFRQRPFVAGLGVNLALLAGIASFFLVLVFYLRVGLGFSAIKTALVALPWPVGIAVAAGISARFAATAGRRLLASGSLLVAVAMVALVLAIDRYGIGIHGWQLIPLLALGGIGTGLVFPPLIDTVLAGVPPEDAGSASGVLNTAQQLGSAVGVAVIGVIFFGLLASQAAASAEQVTPGLRGGLQAAGVPAAVQQQMVAGFQACARDRAATQDPTEVPASCQQTQGQPVASSPHASGRVQQVIGAAADDARKEVFSRATQQTLWFNAGVFVVSFLLSLLLPATPRPRQPEPDQQPTTVTA